MAENTDDFLAHFGVKGMKWGKTRERGSNGRVAGDPHPTSPEPVTVRVQGGNISTAGGRGADAHLDAINARVTKQRIAGSGLNTISNKELQDYITRVNLEQNYTRLSPQHASRGKQFVKRGEKTALTLVGNATKQVAQQALVDAMKNAIKK
jgi:hypothetical protein